MGLTFDEAVARLPNSEMVHTFRQAGFTLIGADWKKDELLNALCKAKVIEETGAQAQAMNHGIAIEDSYGWLFIETSNVQIEARRAVAPSLSNAGLGAILTRDDEDGK